MSINFSMDSSTGMSYLQNQILHKVMKAKTVLLCDVAILRNLGLKL